MFALIVSTVSSHDQFADKVMAFTNNSVTSKLATSTFWSHVFMYIFAQKALSYRIKWFENLNRVDDCRIPKRLWNYKVKGWRHMGRTKKRCVDLLQSVCFGPEQTFFGLILAEDDDDDDVILFFHVLKYTCQITLLNDSEE